MTKLKAVSAVLAAVAVVAMTALGASSAFAWEGVKIWATENCDKGVVVVHAKDNGSHDLKNAGSGTLIFTDAKAGKVVADDVPWEFNSKSDVIGEVDIAELGEGKFKVHLSNDSSVESRVFEVQTCTSASPTASASPTTSTSPTSEASPTSSASPTTSSAAASPTTLPSPPVTGAGPGDGGFSAALVALGLVILVGGGLTLFLSRGASSTTT